MLKLKAKQKEKDELNKFLNDSWYFIFCFIT